MRHIKWTDRVKGTLSSAKEALNFNRGSAIHIAIAVLVAVLITIPVIGKLAPTKSAYDEDMARIDAGMIAQSEGLNGILGLGPLTTQDDLEAVYDTVAAHTYNIAGLQTRMGNAENKIREAQDNIDTLSGSPPEGYLTGTVGNYMLHAKCSASGNFTANVHLVYSPPLWLDDGNSTVEEVLGGFSPAINWVTPTVACNGTMWAITEVAFNIGIFAMAANTETDVDIKFSGLNSTYAPGFAYVEVWPVLQ